MSQGYQDADNLKSIANGEANVIKPIPVEFQRMSGVCCVCMVYGGLGVWQRPADGKKKKAEGGEGEKEKRCTSPNNESL